MRTRRNLEVIFQIVPSGAIIFRLLFLLSGINQFHSVLCRIERGRKTQKQIKRRAAVATRVARRAFRQMVALKELFHRIAIYVTKDS
jgi:hypothetical protein